MAENTQLFQVINIDGNTLRYKAYITTVTLNDAFALQKAKTKGKPNKFKEMQPAQGERKHNNTQPPY
jgi:hypothetical protein